MELKVFVQAAFAEGRSRTAFNRLSLSYYTLHLPLAALPGAGSSLPCVGSVWPRLAQHVGGTSGRPHVSHACASATQRSVTCVFPFPRDSEDARSAAPCQTAGPLDFVR